MRTTGDEAGSARHLHTAGSAAGSWWDWRLFGT